MGIVECEVINVDILKRISELEKERGWTHYHTAKKAGLADSTISNMYIRNTIPNFFTLEAICKAFGITLSQFFFDYEKDVLQIPEELHELFDCWSALSDENKKLAIQFIKALK